MEIKVHRFDVGSFNFSLSLEPFVLVSLRSSNTVFYKCVLCLYLYTAYAYTDQWPKL
jgi:hypothetical protein